MEQKILHYTPFLDTVEGGIRVSIRHQRKALKEEGIDFAKKPGNNCDILHLNTPDPLSIFRMVQAKINDKPVIYHSHVTEEDFRDSMRFSNLFAPIVGRLTDLVYGHADRIISPSEYTRDLLKDRGIETDISVVSNGLDPDRLDGKNRTREELRDEYDVENFCVVNLGMIFERKGLSDFVATAREMENVEFLWFGPSNGRILTDGDTKEKMKSSPENVRFPGYIEDIRDAFELADAFFFPTREENQGMSLLEASYKGSPAIIRDIEIYEEELEHRENCMKGECKEDFVECIRKLKKNDELRQRLSENAEELAENHTISDIGSELARVYRNTAEERR